MVPPRSSARALVAAFVAGAVFAMAPGRLREGRAEGEETTATSVAASNGVVVHGVDQKLLAAHVREIDRRLVAGETVEAAKGLADLTNGDLAALLEEGEGIYLAASESVLQRVSKLPPDALAEYRRILDPRAESALAEATTGRDAHALARDATRLAFTTPGAKLLLTLADLRLAQGDLGGAARALEDLLRLLPSHAEPPVLAHAASRRAALHVAEGDAPGVRGLAADLPAAVLEARSPIGAGGSLRDELVRAATLAERQSPLPAGPSGPLRPALQGAPPGGGPRGGLGSAGREPWTLRDRPLPFGDADRPGLLIRRRLPGSRAQVQAIVPAPAESATPGTVREPRILWAWPSSVSEEPRPFGDSLFAPARLTQDLVVFPWPAPAGDEMAFDDPFGMAGQPRQELVVLSLAAEGKLVEERGHAEDVRPDGDAELERLSFCGRPAVDGRAVYVTAVRPAGENGPTELHVCRFDFVEAGRAGRLQLRWRRHVADGRPIPPALYRVRALDEILLPLTPPSSPLVRAGRVFVASNTGAVACLDAATGRPEWVETYERFGPSARSTVKETELVTWDDVPLAADGPFLFAAPRDAETLLQFRRAPRGARSARVEEFAFAGPNGTARSPGRLLPDLVPTDVGAVRDGVIYLSGRVARRPIAGVALDGSPLAAFRLDERRAFLAQVQEHASAGPPTLVRGALLFPTPKAVYRVSLDDFEGAPETLWRNPSGGDVVRGTDWIGVLVPDGERLWSVTPARVLLLEPAK